jgi:hypothetical protein
MEKVFQFLFVIAVPLLLVGGGLVTFFGVGALFEALEEPEELKRRIEGAFRKPPKPSHPIGPDHYYRQYWTEPPAKRSAS